MSDESNETFDPELSLPLEEEILEIWQRAKNIEGAVARLESALLNKFVQNFADIEFQAQIVCSDVKKFPLVIPAINTIRNLTDNKLIEFKEHDSGSAAMRKLIRVLRTHGLEILKQTGAKIPVTILDDAEHLIDTVDKILLSPFGKFIDHLDVAELEKNLAAAGHLIKKYKNESKSLTSGYASNAEGIEIAIDVLTGASAMCKAVIYLISWVRFSITNNIEVGGEGGGAIGIFVSAKLGVDAVSITNLIAYPIQAFFEEVNTVMLAIVKDLQADLNRQEVQKLDNLSQDMAHIKLTVDAIAKHLGLVIPKT